MNTHLFLSVDFVNISPKSGGGQTKIVLDPPGPPSPVVASHCKNGVTTTMINKVVVKRLNMD